MNKLLVNNISKSFGSKRILDKVNFSIDENEFVAIIGNNGVGKSSLLKIICQIIEPDSGNLSFSNEKIKKEELGIVLDKSYLIEEYCPEEYLNFIASFSNVKVEHINERINDLFKMLDISEPKKLIKKLSSGNRMKITIAAALINNPKIIILDEPFTNLDIDIKLNLLKILKTFKGDKTLLISSHNLEDVIDLCDRFLILKNGDIQKDYLKEDFKSNKELKTIITQQIFSQREVEKYKWLSNSK